MKLVGRAERQPTLPRRYWRLLKQGDTRNEYGSDPLRIVGELVRLAGEYGRPLTLLERDLQNPANAAAAYVRTAGNPRGRVRLVDLRTWYERDASTPRRQQWDRDKYREQLDTLQQLAGSRAWPVWVRREPADGVPAIRVKGSDMRKVLAALIELARQSEGIDFLASRRHTADMAGVSASCAQRCLQVAQAHGIVKRRRPPGDDPGGPFLGSWYRLDTTGRALRTVLRESEIELGELAQFERHPFWRHGCGCRFDVWAFIVAADGTATTAEIAAQLDVSRDSVRRYVRSMEQLGLVERCDDYTLRAATVDHRAALDGAALQTGMADRARRQLERHEAERAAFLEFVLRSPRLLLAALRKGARAVIAAIAAGRVVNAETGEVVTVSAERERRPLQLLGIGRPHAPPRRPLVLA